MINLTSFAVKLPKKYISYKRHLSKPAVPRRVIPPLRGSVSTFRPRFDSQSTQIYTSGLIFWKCKICHSFWFQCFEPLAPHSHKQVCSPLLMSMGFVRQNYFPPFHSRADGTGDEIVESRGRNFKTVWESLA